MTVSLSHVHVLVDDPEASVSFYRDTLGLTVRARDAAVRDPAGNLIRIEQE